MSVFYWLIAASIAELASAMPSAGGGWSFEADALKTVYHWLSITAGQHGRICGWFAGWWNFLAWIFGLAASIQITATQTVSMYAVFHPSFAPKRWQVFVAYLADTWLCCFLLLFANGLLPRSESLAAF